MLQEIVRPPTVKETVANTLRDAIWRGDLKPGEPLREEELAGSLKVARGTLREAFRELEEEGLVEAFPHRGVFVTTLSLRKAREIYSMRALLEPYAVRLAVENGAYSEHDREEIEALVKQIGELERQDDQFERVKTDLAFHYRICVPSDHHLLLHMLGSLQSLATLCLYNLSKYRFDKIPQEVQHREILEVIRAGDPLRARDVVREHLRAARDNLLSALRAAEADPDNKDW